MIMLRNNRDIVGCVIAVALTFGLSLLGDAIPWLTLARLPLGLVSVLFVPGYLLLAALPRLRELDGKLGLAVAVGLSLAIVPFLALLLDYSGLGLSTLAIAASLLALTLPLAALSLQRRSGAAVKVGANPRSAWRFRHMSIGARLAVAGLALLIVGGAAVSYAVSQTPPPPYTEFYVLNASGQAQDYPQATSDGVPLTVTLGVINDEGAAASYRVEVSDGGKVVANVAVGPLAAGQIWERQSYLSLPSVSGEQAVQLLLYKDGIEPPYRQLRLILGRAGTWQGD